MHLPTWALNLISNAIQGISWIVVGVLASFGVKGHFLMSEHEASQQKIRLLEDTVKSLTSRVRELEEKEEIKNIELNSLLQAANNYDTLLVMVGDYLKEMSPGDQALVKRMAVERAKRRDDTNNAIAEYKRQQSSLKDLEN